MEIQEDHGTRDRMVQEWVRYACLRNGRPDLAIQIKIEWSSHLKRSYAWCWPSQLRMRISKHNWYHSTVEENKDTIIHETCHLITGEREHKGAWCEAMRMAGLDPKKCSGPRN
jgi:hypothetical protein